MSSDGSSTVVLFRALPATHTLSAGEKRTLLEFARSLSSQVTGKRSFTCLITNDHELLRLNREFLNRDYPADVLSFPASDGDPDIGEIAISIERAAAQTEDYSHALLDELRILMLHGALHLTGLDHERDSGEMARAERKWRGVFGLPSTLIARARSRPVAQRPITTQLHDKQKVARRGHRQGIPPPARQAGVQK